MIRISFGRMALMSVIFGTFCAQASYTPMLNQPTGSLRLMTFNILVKRPMIDRKSRDWKNRAPLVAQLVRQYMPDVIGFQEVTEEQKNFLQAALAGSGYIAIGEKRAPDQKTMGMLPGRPGEYALIMYNKNTIQLDTHETIWLSETGERYKKGWDAKLPRICTTAQCTVRATGKKFFIGNLHLALESVAQRQGAQLVAQIANERAVSQQMPAFILGDFNMRPSDVLPQLHKHIPSMVNAKDCARSQYIAHDEAQGGTRVGWKKLDEASYVIDHIFMDQAYPVASYAIPVRTDDKRWKVSDHRPVMVDIEL